MSNVVQIPERRGRGGGTSGTVRVNQAERPLDLRWLLGVLRRRKMVVAAIVLIVPAIVTAMVLNITPRYEALARILIEGQREKILDFDSVMPGMPFDLSTVETEAEVIRSRELASKAVVALDLLSHPEYNPTLKKKKLNWRKLVKQYTVEKPVAWLRTKVDLTPYEKTLPFLKVAEKKKPSQEDLFQGAVTKFQNSLLVVPAALARVITVQVSSTDPELAARAANLISELYIEEQTNEKLKANERASLWLEDRVAEMRDLVVASQRKLEEFRTEAGIVELAGVSLVRQQFAHLNGELLKAENIRAEIATRYEQARSLLGDGGGIQSAADVLKSRLIGDLRIRETDLLRRLAEMRTRYRDEHPRVVQLHDQLTDLRKVMAEEVDKVLINLRNETAIANMRVEKLTALTRETEEKFAEERKAEVALRALETEVNANKQLYEVLLERFKQTDVQDATLQSAEARIISRAVVPTIPVYPRKRILVLASILVALVAGVVLAVGREYFIAGYRTVRELEQDSGVPVLSMMPVEPALRRKDASMARYLDEKPHSRIAEAVKKLRSEVALAGRPDGGKVIAVSSAVRGEGKSSIAASLATLVARAGHRVLLVDGNMRSRRIHHLIGQRNIAGLSDVLAGDAHQDTLVEFHFQTGMYYLTAGTPHDNPENLLESAQMDEFIRWARRQFEYVIIDTPPILLVPDAQVIMSRADECVLCARWEVTPRESVKRAARTVRETGAKLAGIVMTQVDLGIQRMVYGTDYSNYFYYDAKDAA